MAEDLRAEDFAPFVRKPFQPISVPVPLLLVSLKRAAQPSLTAVQRYPFSLILRGPPGTVVPEGLYRFLADGLQTFELYLAPVHTLSRDHQDYQIAFD